MKSLSSLLLLPALFLAPACSGEEAQAKMSEMADAGGKMLGENLDKLKELDLSNLADMSADKAKGMFSDATAGIADKLSSVKDLADAEQLKENVGPMLDKLTALKDKLGDNMPSMDSLKSSVMALKDKFAGDNAIMQVLQPLLDKLQALMA